MPTYYSDNGYLANAVGDGIKALSAMEQSGRICASCFVINSQGLYTTALDGTVVSTQIAVGDTLVLCRIPARSKILRVVLNPSVALGATPTISLGLSGADGSGFYTGTTADSAALLRVAAVTPNTINGEFTGADTAASNHGYITTKDVNLTATVGVAALPSSAWTMRGYVLYSTQS